MRGPHRPMSSTETTGAHGCARPYKIHYFTWMHENGTRCHTKATKDEWGLLRRSGAVRDVTCKRCLYFLGLHKP